MLNFTMSSITVCLAFQKPFDLLCCSMVPSHLVFRRYHGWAIRGLGNVLRHEYGDVDATIIWVTLAEGDLSALLAVAETEFERLG